MLIPCSPHIPGQLGTRAALVVRRVGTLALSLVLAVSASAAESLNIVFTCHAATTNSFWQAVKLGFDDACIFGARHRRDASTLMLSQEILIRTS